MSQSGGAPKRSSARCLAAIIPRSATAARGAQNVWVVNVGDIKPMELPLEFIMRMAWDPAAMTPRSLAEYPRKWAERIFEQALASEIGALVTRYGSYAARRKPELLNESTFAIGSVEGPVLHGGE
jgi:hypothetical protein